MAANNRSAFAAAGKVFREKGVSRRVLDITISAIKEMPLLAAKVPGCISLGQGIPSFGTPEHIITAAKDALDNLPAAGKYTLGPGLPELKEAAAAQLKETRGIEADPDKEICITVGAMEGLLAGMLTLVDDGDEVILPSPNYASHIEQVIVAGGKAVFAPLNENDWSLNIEAMEAAITPRTRAMILCSPHNPTGAVFAPEDLEQAAQLAVDHDLTVITDEAYDFLVYDDRPSLSPASLPQLKDRVFAAFSLSKKYAMTGWRVGYVYSSEGIIDHLLKVHDCGAICAPTVSQYAALAAMTGPQDCTFLFRDELRSRRDLAMDRLGDLSDYFRCVKPSGAYYLMPKWVGPAMDSMTLALRLLYEAKVITIPGAAFGPTGENHVRMCFGGTEDEINHAFDRIARWCNSGAPEKEWQR